MKKILAPIFREHFNFFYREGYTFLPKSSIIRFDGNFSSKAIGSKLVEKFRELQAFQYEEEYVILEIEVEDEKLDKGIDPIQVSIEEIKSVIPLSLQAKKSMEGKMDQRIQFSDPIFEDILPNIIADQVSKNRRKGIEAIWHMMRLKKKELDIFLNEVDLESISKGLDYRNRSIKADLIEDEKFWSYLIAYDRYEYFPKTSLGYFYDVGEILTYMMGAPKAGGPRPYIQNAQVLYSILEKCNNTNPNIKTEEIFDVLEEDAVNFIKNLTLGNIKAYVVAVWFLKFKEELREDIDFEETNLCRFGEKLIDIYGDEFKYVIILLGAFFGFDRFYDAYYNSVGLRFFKPTSLSKDIQEKETAEAESLSNKVEGKMDIKRGEKKLESSNGENKVSGTVDLEVKPKIKKGSEGNAETEKEKAVQLEIGLDEQVSQATKSSVKISEKSMPASNNSSESINTDKPHSKIAAKNKEFNISEEADLIYEIIKASKDGKIPLNELQNELKKQTRKTKKSQTVLKNLINADLKDVKIKKIGSKEYAVLTELK